ncbi:MULTISPECIES: acyl-CoA dehydrogenase family protein [unclassified Beijerinckia]|uniref:acyl-CoA dehydrogenase family protein n=1 Tax=unclassified Beijerinckia TaxID=2638183 RepID=UPI00089AA8C0|nr:MULTISPECIES: acyl-CoA dehydrogenase family protein [unclassified Beijerinckia]MDH7798051.1 (2S)-methylsuccinyl-CoA dehydrogenase [Beijerinckia sp. GAS462]SED07243.1 (2S)-methylsuccinyl-CoA dehydrogenase [Beijerinckia sp. 28-YEA-48]
MRARTSEPHSDVDALLALLPDAVTTLTHFEDAARARVRKRLGHDAACAASRLDTEQRALHGLAWLATYRQVLQEICDHLKQAEAQGQASATTQLMALILSGEYLAQCFGGLPMSQSEIARPSDFGFSAAEASSYQTSAIERLIAQGNTAETRAALMRALRQAEPAQLFNDGADDDLTAITETIFRYVETKVAPHAHGWHRDNAYIPLDIITELSSLGVFGLTMPESYGGLGLGKTAMCAVTEELSRGYIGVGSLGTRSEIAAELLLAGGTAEQKQKYLPGIASGEIITTAVFTEPDAGSDLASLRLRATPSANGYLLRGAKAWITHAARADLMLVLARTGSAEARHDGLSMFLVEKPRGNDADSFTLQGLSGSEIEVLGYRGMKEFELMFDDVVVPASALLGEVEGRGFRQLMQTFESARIQTAARAIGVARAAFELAMRYALERRQFNKALMDFPRVSDKIAMMAVEIFAARLLTHFAARAKDLGRRCDLEAGMAKLLAARVAWAAADSTVQIHGGTGFALEHPASRLLCDARILSIFEGAAEIQAHVIGRRLLEEA